MRFNTWHLVAFGVLALSACKSRAFHSDVSDKDFSKAKSDGLATVNWTCEGKGKQHPAGKTSQEEYCEWTRNPQAFSGTGTPVNGGAQTKINVAKACVFTTSFDQTREFHLTKFTTGKDKSQGNPFWATQFNSYAFLVGDTEPDSGIVRGGIINHCLTGKACFAPNCVPDRASDPQICDALQTLGSKGCKVNTKFEVAPVITAGSVPSRRQGDQVVKLQLSVRANIGPSCWYAVDPKLAAGAKNSKGQIFNEAEQRTLVVCDAAALSTTNCDDLASDLTTSVTLKIESTACVGGTGSSGGGPAFKDNVTCTIVPSGGDLTANARDDAKSSANLRTSVDKGARIFIRGFVGDWASVQFEKGGQKFGAGDGTPTFIHKSQFDLGSCK